MQRLLPPVLVLILIGLTAALHAAISPPTLPAVGRWLGAPIAAAGLRMSAAGSRRFDDVGTNIKTFDPPNVLVIDGLFGWSRNPMYLGFVVVLVGFAIGLGSVAGLAAPVAFFLAADRWYIPFEEAEMRRVFEMQYDHYRQRVRRWVGRRTIA